MTFWGLKVEQIHSCSFRKSRALSIFLRQSLTKTSIVCEQTVWSSELLSPWERDRVCTRARWRREEEVGRFSRDPGCHWISMVSTSDRFTMATVNKASKASSWAQTSPHNVKKPFCGKLSITCDVSHTHLGSNDFLVVHGGITENAWGIKTRQMLEDAHVIRAKLTPELWCASRSSGTTKLALRELESFWSLHRHVSPHNSSLFIPPHSREQQLNQMRCCTAGKP